MQQQSDIELKVKEIMIDCVESSGLTGEQKSDVVSNINRLHEEGKLMEFARKNFGKDNDLDKQLDEIEGEFWENYETKLAIYYELLKALQNLFKKKGEADDLAFQKVKEFDEKVMDGKIELDKVILWIYQLLDPKTNV